jgi:glycosyltransferase involved in cell wall biosynthesis
MRVLLLAPQPFYQERGTPIAVRLALEALVRKLEIQAGDESVIDLLTYGEGEEIEITGVRIIRIPTPSCLLGIRPGISLKKLLCDVIFAFSTFKLLWKARHAPYSVVHAVEESVFIAWLAKQLFGTPYIYDMDSSLALQVTEKWWLLKPALPIFQFFERMAVRGSIAVAPVCDALEAIATNHGSPHTVMLRDVSLLPQGDHELLERSEVFGDTIHDSQPVILYVGNLESYQGIDLLIESFALVRGHESGPHLAIVGGTADAIAKYRGKAESLGCAGCVTFLGPRPVAHLKSYLSRADILVSPRIKGNNTPMKIYSYLHSGKALLATDLPTHRQVLDEEISVLAPAEPQGFAKGLQLLLEDPLRRQEIGERARVTAEKLYTREAFEAQLFALYEQVQQGVSRAIPRAAVPVGDDS